MPNAPDEVVAAPLTLFLATVGTAFPEIDDLEADFNPAWEKLGTEGANNYDDGGVDMDHSETVNDWTPAGSTMPSKRFRIGEAFGFDLKLVDVGPTAWAKVMNNATVSDIAAGVGVAGQSHFSLFRGISVASFAVIARGVSPIDNDLNLQLEVSKAFVSVNGKVTWDKKAPAMLPVNVLAIRHSPSDVIDVRMQSAEAS